MSARGLLLLRAAGAWCFVVFVLAVWSGPTSAALTHQFVTSFGSFANVQGIAVDEASQNVYVYDAGAGAIYKFNASGAPETFSGSKTDAIAVPGAGQDEGEIAVDNSSGPAKGDIYLAHGSAADVLVFNMAGERVGELTEEGGKPWGEACGVAVDAAGDVYIGLGSGHVNKYAPTANPVNDSDYVSSLSGLTGEICNVAADSLGSVYADTWPGGPVTKYEGLQFGSPAASGTVLASNGSTLAVELATNNVYVDHTSGLVQYDSTGTQIAVFGSTGPGALNGGSFGVAVNGKANEVYASANGEIVTVFGPAVVVPDVTTGLAKTTGASVALEGEVNPDGKPATVCEFEYGLTTGYGQSVPCETNPGSGSSPVTVTAALPLAGLAENTEYHYRLIAANANGSNTGDDATVITPGPPTIGGESVSNIAMQGAMLEGQINAGDEATSYSFVYATNEALNGAVTVDGTTTLEGFGDQPVSTTLVGTLKPGVTYYYQVTAENAKGATQGTIRSFSTVPATPLTDLATEVTGRTALLHGRLNPSGPDGEVGFYFEYNTGAACSGEGAQRTTQEQVPEADNAAVDSGASGLSPKTQYTFCLVAANDSGATPGSGVQFETKAGQPVVEEETSSEQTASGTKLAALINPSGAATTCKVQYGPEASYGSETPCPEGLGEGLAGKIVDVTLAGLQPNKTYHYRFDAANGAGEGQGEGADQTFKTLMSAPISDQAPTALGVGRASVLLSGTANPENSVVFYHFIYGPTAKYGSSTPVIEGGSGFGDEQVSQQLERLAPGTTYHYALVISNPAGSETISGGTFTTSPSAPPVAVTGAASSITATSATLAGTVQPSSLTSTYAFQIGIDTTYGGELSEVAGSDSQAAPVSATFANLQPGTVYHYRLTASNEDGISYGADQTFTTAGVSSSIVQPQAPLLITIPQTQFPTESTTTKPNTKTLTSVQKLARALRACKKRPRDRRAGCVRQARRKYTAAKKKVPKG